MLTLVECTRARLAAVNEFWSRAYSPDHVLATDQTLFEWQFGCAAGVRADRTSTADCYHMKLAMDDGRVAGCLGFIPMEVMLRGRIVRGCWLANWKVAPEFARLGLGPLLLREVLLEADVVVNVGISDDARRLLTRMGWLDLGTLSRWVRPLHIGHADALLSDDADGEWPARTAPPNGTSGFTLQPVQEFGVDTGHLWDEVWGAQGAGTRRSAQLLNWRYALHPRFRYELLELRQHSMLVGFGVYRIENVQWSTTKIGRIVELVATPAAAPALIAGVCGHAAERDVAMLDFFCTSRRLDGELQAQGFQPGDTGRALHMPGLFHPIDRRRTEIACMIYSATVELPGSSDAWYATKGDADQDRPN